MDAIFVQPVKEMFQVPDSCKFLCVARLAFGILVTWFFNRYKLVIRVADKGEEMTCVLFNEAAVLLLGITVDDLLIKSLTKVC
jgi:hypothetical protein